PGGQGSWPLEPEPFHHNNGVFTVCIITVDVEDLSVSDLPVKLLGCVVGESDLQLNTRCELDGKLVLLSPDKHPSHSHAPELRCDCKVTDVPIYLFPCV